MHIICLTPLEDGVYNDHQSDIITAPPEGWAYIPEDFPKPSTFPRLGSLEAVELAYTHEIEVENRNEETGETEIVIEQRTKMMMTVTKMTEGTLPEPTPEPTSDNIWDELDAAYTEGVNSI